jgi:hypothetical protein
MAFKSVAEIDDPVIEIDALVQTESTCTAAGNIKCAAGDFAQIRKDGALIFQGIVKDFNYNGNKTEIVLNQLSNLLETDVFADVSLLKTQKIETWLGNILYDLFAGGSGSDPFQALPGFTLTNTPRTSGTYTKTDSGAYRVLDLAVSFFKVYGVILDISFDAHARSVSFVFRTVPTTPVHLDLSVSDVSSYEIEAASETQRANKVIIKNADNMSQEQTYYWHEDDFSGRVDTDGAHDRLLPVVAQCDTIQLSQGETFADASYDRAYEILYATRYDDLIKIEMRRGSALINTDPNIGQLFALHDGETIYKTMLTGKEYLNAGQVRLTFGYVRKRLTQILKMRGSY